MCRHAPLISEARFQQWSHGWAVAIEHPRPWFGCGRCQGQSYAGHTWGTWRKATQKRWIINGWFLARLQPWVTKWPTVWHGLRSWKNPLLCFLAGSYPVIPIFSLQVIWIWHCNCVWAVLSILGRIGRVHNFEGYPRSCALPRLFCNQVSSVVANRNAPEM